MTRLLGVAAGLAALAAVTACSVSVEGGAKPPAGEAPPVTTVSSAPPEATSPAVEVQIPTERTPLPRRPKPLASPAKCSYRESPEPPSREVSSPKQTQVPAKGQVDVTLQTSAGEIGLTLDRALAPCTVNSMLSLIQQGFFDGSQCHRLGIEPSLQMLQCGDPTGTGTGGPGYTVPDEQFPQTRYGRGILAMANTGQPDSGGSQFFMVYGSANLPPDYAVFGSIDDAGLKVLDKVARGGIDTSAPSPDGTGPPNIPVTFTKVIAPGD